MTDVSTLYTEVALLDELLAQWREPLGRDATAYRNHCYRVFNLTCALTAAGAEERDRIAVAVAFHDIGIWLDSTFDYLEPSASRARRYLHERGHDAWSAQVESMVRSHHRVRPLPDPLADGFRRADWLDVSLFLLPSRVPRPFRHALLKAFPRAGFHWRLVVFTLRWWWRHPLRPLPMMRW